MPQVDELFANQMSWPRLVIKGLVEGLLCYNFYHYATAERPDWDCFATDKRQPNGLGEGENITEKFTTVIYSGFIVTLVALLISLVEMCNKSAKNK